MSVARYGQSFPIIEFGASSPGYPDSIDIFSEKWDLVTACLVQLTRLREQALDLGCVLLLPGEWYPTITKIYGLPVVHITGLDRPILGYQPQAPTARLRT